MLMENGIRPCWVFDGKPPDAKGRTLEERKKKKQTAEENKQKAIENEDAEQAVKWANQSVVVTKEMIEDAKKMVRLLGLPVIEVIFAFFYDNIRLHLKLKHNAQR